MTGRFVGTIALTTAFTASVASVDFGMALASPVVPVSPDARVGAFRIDGLTVAVSVARGARNKSYRWSPETAVGPGAWRVTMRESASGAVTDVRYRLDWGGTPQLLGQRLITTASWATLTQRYSLGGVPVTVTTRLRVTGGSLTIDVTADRPGPVALRLLPPQGSGVVREIMPYSPVDVYRTAGPPQFFSAFFDWTASAATSLDDGVAAYLLRTDGTRNALQERLVVTVADTVLGVMPGSGWPRSRFYDRVTGRLMVDVTETIAFADIEKQLEGMYALGLSDCVVVIHAWQRMGYDNGFPTVLPVNAYLGGEAAIQQIARRAREQRCQFALHQNYIDLYPNAETFDPTLIGLKSDGRRLDGWLNRSLGIQSYLVKPRAFAAQADRHAPDIRRSVGTTASFLDVNSGFKPWQRVDMDAREPDGGRFSAFVAGTKSLFETMQRVEAGPVYGEGHYHFYWAGALDGVEAQMTVGNRNDVRTTPMWVDFAMRRIRPVMHGFGMGFYDRYAPPLPTSRDPLADENNRELYRTQQIAYGHMPYRSGIAWGNLRLFVQEAALAGSVAQATGSADAAAITYWLGGRWVPLEGAIAAARPLPVRVRYSNGVVVTANTSNDVATDARGTRLSRANWSAVGPGLEAWSTGEGAGRRDFSRLADAMYADPRGAAGNWAGSGSAALTDFGAVRTNGQTWFRCVGGRWQVTGQATRGTVDIEVANAVIPQPRSIRSPATPDLRVAAHSGDFWSARLISGELFVTDARCKAGS